MQRNKLVKEESKYDRKMGLASEQISADKKSYYVAAQFLQIKQVLFANNVKINECL
jgi:hypothetical protein